MGIEDQKRAAGEAAALAIETGMVVGLGTGSTVAYFLPALARRRLTVRCIATSPATEALATRLGLALESFDSVDRLDVAVDGADQVAADGWLVKGGGGAHVREKVVAEAADRFLVIVSRDKLVERLGPPVPLEVMRFGLGATLRRVASLGGSARVRVGVPPTPGGNVIVDYGGGVADPSALARAFEGITGIVGHGLFAPALVTEVLVGHDDGGVDRLVP